MARDVTLCGPVVSELGEKRRQRQLFTADPEKVIDEVALVKSSIARSQGKAATVGPMRGGQLADTIEQPLSEHPHGHMPAKRRFNSLLCLAEDLRGAPWVC